MIKKIQIESSTRCALECPKCDRTKYKKLGIPFQTIGRDMPMADYKK